MSTRLPADILSRRRLEGTYRLTIAALRDISRPLFDPDDVTTVRGSSRREMSIEGEDDVNAHDYLTKCGRRLLKVVLADSADRLLMAYEYERWGEEIADGMKVGTMVDIIGPIQIENSTALLHPSNIRIRSVGSVPLSSSAVSTTAVGTAQQHPQQLQAESWMQDLPSDFFLPDEDIINHDDVIVIDE